jgi:hypothetical protein
VSRSKAIAYIPTLPTGNPARPVSIVETSGSSSQSELINPSDDTLAILQILADGFKNRLFDYSGRKLPDFEHVIILEAKTALG